MKAYRLDVFVLSIGCLSVIEYYIAEARHRQGHDEENSDSRRRHRSNRQQDGWRPWGPWSSCNAECGTGVTVRLRECTHDDGRSPYEMCRGQKKEFKICNTQECVGGQKTLRDKLCSKHDNDNLGNSKRYRWIPYLLHSNRCELICRAAGYGFYNSFPERVTNGSICNHKGTAVCIEDVCRKFGCDGIVGSHAVTDRCGVCGGDGGTCQLIRELYEVRSPKYGYSKIGTIPAGATQINITQLRRSRNYIALKIKDGRYFINGNRRLSPQGDHKGAGTVFTYTRTRSITCPSECVTAEGPTNADIDIKLLAFGVNGGISYSFASPISDGGSGVDTHGGNKQQENKDREIIVEDHFNVHIDTTLVHHNESDYNVTEVDLRKEYVTLSNVIPTVQSENGTRNEINVSTTIFQNDVINDVTTPAYDVDNILPTVINDNSAVTSSPGVIPGNGNGKRMPKYTQSFRFMEKMRMKNRRRNNNIYRSQNDKRYKGRRYPPIIVEDHFGQPDTSGTRDQPVVNKDGMVIKVDRDESVMITGDRNRVRAYRYVLAGYTECSRTCGTGRQQPKIKCMYNDRYIDDRYCRNLPPPNTQPLECNNQPCTQSAAIWNTGEWSSCSVTCGEGFEKRTVNCVQEITSGVYSPADDCEAADEPDNIRSCQTQACSTWETGPWTSCSVTCGTGIKRRQVTCVLNLNSIGDTGSCDQSQKPAREESCYTKPCTTSNSNTSNWYSNDWPSECPVDCGSGTIKRHVLCLGDDMRQHTGCSAARKPETEKICKSGNRCRGFWFTGPWGKCNATCGPGMQSRDITCVHGRRSGNFHVVAESNCRGDDKPESHMSCLIEECSPQWFTSGWSECPTTCGPGQQTREVKCLDAKFRQSRRCHDDIKPPTTRQCDSGRCNPRPTTTPQPDNSECIDTYAHCSLVIRTNLCAYDYYRGLCCDACKRADNS